jgi:hypothetical protein
VYIVHIKAKDCFYLLCTFRKAIKNSEVKVDVEKGVLRFREKNIMTFQFSFIYLKYIP